jgi:predicted SprT family Zn-dependent metalloprotease
VGARMKKIPKILKRYGLTAISIKYTLREHKELEGRFDPDSNSITIWCSPENDIKDTLLHELSHAILFKQGMPYLNHGKNFTYLMEELKNLK